MGKWRVNLIVIGVACIYVRRRGGKGNLDARHTSCGASSDYRIEPVYLVFSNNWKQYFVSLLV